MLIILLEIVKAIAIISIISLVIYLMIEMITVYCKGRRKYRKHGIKFRVNHYKYKLRKHEFNLKLVEIMKWVYIDRKREKYKLYGIWAFTGYFGQGKTLGAVTFARRLQKTYKEKNIKIYSNFNMKGQNGKITSWEDLIKLPACTIVIFDEIQSTFTSLKYKDFPMELLWKITQCRKNELAIFCTTPVYSRMSIQLRESTDYIIECKNVLNLDRYFKYDFYRAPEYEKKGMREIKKEFTVNVIANNEVYKSYDTNQIVDRFDVVVDNKKSNKKSIEDIIKIAK